MLIECSSLKCVGQQCTPGLGLGLLLVHLGLAQHTMNHFDFLLMCPNSIMRLCFQCGLLFSICLEVGLCKSSWPEYITKKVMGQERTPLNIGGGPSHGAAQGV